MQNGIVLPSGRITNIPGVYPPGDSGAPIKASAGPPPPPPPGYYTITVTPSVSIPAFDMGGNQTNAPTTFTVHINRFNGHVAPVDVTCPMASSEDGLGFSVNGVQQNVPEAQVLTAAPDTFTIEISGTGQGWSSFNADYPDWETGVVVTGDDHVLAIVTSNSFSTDIPISAITGSAVLEVDDVSIPTAYPYSVASLAGVTYDWVLTCAAGQAGHLTDDGSEVWFDPTGTHINVFAGGTQHLGTSVPNCIVWGVWGTNEHNYNVTLSCTITIGAFSKTVSLVITVSD